MDINAALAERDQAIAAEREAVNQKLADLKKGIVDPVVLDKLNKAADAVTGLTETANVAIKEAKAAKEAAEALEAKMNRPGFGQKADEAEMKAVGEFQGVLDAAFAEKGKQAPKVEVDAYRTYRKAFETFVRRGHEGLSSEESIALKAMSVGVGPDGGYLVHPDMSGQIATVLRDSSPVRAIASVQSISTASLKGLRDIQRTDASWVGETESRSATTTAQLGEWEIPVREMYSFPQATQDLIDDAAVDVEAWMAGKVAEDFALTESTAFVSGNTPKRPRGFTTYPTAATADSSRGWGTMEHVATGTNGSFGTSSVGAEKLIQTMFKLRTGYRPGAVWAMSKTTLAGVRQLKDAAGSFIWLPNMANNGAAEVNPYSGSLFGHPVVEMEDMDPFTTTDALAVAFGNFRRGYQIVDRIGIRVTRDNLTNKPYVGLYATKRVGGDVIHFEAIKFLKFGS
jgi:HK97 family phage major capsid protein